MRRLVAAFGFCLIALPAYGQAWSPASDEGVFVPVAAATRDAVLFIDLTASHREGDDAFGEVLFSAVGTWRFALPYGYLRGSFHVNCRTGEADIQWRSYADEGGLSLGDPRQPLGLTRSATVEVLCGRRSLDASAGFPTVAAALAAIPDRDTDPPARAAFP